MSSILIHHHAVAYNNLEGIRLNSFIANWVIELGNYFNRVGLLLHESSEILDQQDLLIKKNNIVLESLGAPGVKWDRIKRMKRINAKCHALDGKYDYLLIRGMTPRQLTVWENIKVKHKWFFLVQSIRYNYKIYDVFNLYLTIMERYRLQELKKISKSGFLIANSLTTVDEIKELLFKKCFFVPTNTIKKTDFPILESRKIVGQIKLLFCGRIEKQKGIIELINAVQILNKKKISCQLNLVGQIYGGFKKELMTIIKEKEIEHVVHFKGYVKFGPKLFKYYGESDIFVLPSYSEGFPHAIWEAAANSCPILTTSVGGIAKLLEDKIHAVLVPPRDSYALVDSIIEINNNDSLRKTITANAYNLAVNYTVEECAKILAETVTEKNV